MRRLSAAALGIVLAACNASVAPSPSPEPRASTTPVASAIATSTPIAATPAPPSPPAVAATAVPLPAGAAWQRLGAIGDHVGVAGVLVFQGRYLAYGQDATSLPWVWTSSTGDTWQATKLGQMIQPCPEYAEDQDSQVRRGATDGHIVTLVGQEYALDAQPCGTQRAASWVTDDGSTWQRGHGFGGDGSYAQSMNVWAAGGGWEALAWMGSDRRQTLWRSADGLSWAGRGPLDVPETLSATISAAADGTRVMVVRNDEGGSEEETFGLRGGESRLRFSLDGTTWTDVAYDFNAQGPAYLQVAVDKDPATGNAWIVFGGRNDGTPATIWRSTDLVHWQSVTFPRADVSALTWSQFGYIAMGSDIGCGDGGECPPTDPPGMYLSPDGLGWTPLEADLEAYTFIDGPAGLLAIDGESRAWVLR